MCSGIHVEAVRELFSDPERCLQQLIADGICKEPSRCSHCGSHQVQRSRCHRGARDGHLFISCAKCAGSTLRSGCARAEAFFRERGQSCFQASANVWRSSSWSESLPMPYSPCGSLYSSRSPGREPSSSQACEAASTTAARITQGQCIRHKVSLSRLIQGLRFRVLGFFVRRALTSCVRISWNARFGTSSQKRRKGRANCLS